MGSGGGARHSAAARLETASALAAVILTGVTVGSAGTLVHRLQLGAFPVGLLAAVLLAAAGTVFARSLHGRGTGALHAALTLGTTGVFLAGGDDQILLLDALGWAWIAGALAVAVAVLLAPGRWFGAGAQAATGAEITQSDASAPPGGEGAAITIANGE